MKAVDADTARALSVVYLLHRHPCCGGQLREVLLDEHLFLNLLLYQDSVSFEQL